MPKRYIVFAGSDYYPCGGCLDKELSTDLLDEAVAFATKQSMEEYKWSHVYDVFEEKIVWESHNA